MWPFSKSTDDEQSSFRYKTVETIVYSDKYVFTLFDRSDAVEIHYAITADVVERDDFIAHQLLDDNNKHKYLSDFIGGIIFQSLAPYHFLYDKDGYVRFHKIIDINSESVTIAETPEHINSVISKIDKDVCRKTIAGVKFTLFTFNGVKKYVQPKQRLLRELKQVRGQYIELADIKMKKIQTYSYSDFTIVPIAFNDYIHIQYEHSFKRSGNVRIYRRTGGYAQDELSETENGILVFDNDKRQCVHEELDLKEKTVYYYTVNFKYTSPPLFSKPDEKPKTIPITRFTAMLADEPVQREPEKSQIDIYKEQQDLEIAKEEVGLNRETIVRVNKIKAHAKDKVAIMDGIKSCVNAFREKLVKENNGRSSKKIEKEVEDFESDLMQRADVISSE